MVSWPTLSPRSPLHHRIPVCDHDRPFFFWLITQDVCVVCAHVTHDVVACTYYEAQKIKAGS
jgi:hypothetical protein